MTFKTTRPKSRLTRRLLSTALAMALVVGLLPTAALAANTSGSSTVSYSRANPEVPILNAYTGTAIYENLSFGVAPVDIVRFTGDLIANYIKNPDPACQ